MFYNLKYANPRMVTPPALSYHNTAPPLSQALPIHTSSSTSAIRAEGRTGDRAVG